MFLDAESSGGPGGEPWNSSCHGCKSLIVGNDIAEIEFGPHVSHDLQKLNGIYHRACAKPILAVKRVYDMLGRNHFG